MNKTIEITYDKIKNLTGYINFKIILAFQVLFLVIGVFFGLTGSSIGCMQDYGNFFSYDLHGLTGTCRSIRSDEWAVDTPLAISQFNNHNEQFPLKNKNFGIEGKLMSVVHDTGTPVAEPALLAKPATWGFFLFDLRRALSWYWLFPLFIAINGIFLFLQLIFRGQTAANFALSLCLAFSYHSVVWSFWPAYQIGLGALATSFFILLYQNEKTLNKFIFSVLLGLSVAALILTLYLPRIIPIVTFFSLVLAAYFIREKLYKRTPINYLFLLIGLIVTVSICLSWYINNREAINAILESSYPGLRRTYYGDGHLWDEFRGWLHPVFLKRDLGFLNISELGMYCSYIIPFAYILFKLRKSIDLIIVSIVISLLFSYTYIYVGIPEIIGKITFWNRTTFRAIIGTDLALIVFAAWLYSKRDKIKVTTVDQLVALVIFSSTLFILVHYMPDVVKSNIFIYDIRFTWAVIILLVCTYSAVTNFRIFPYVYMISLLCFTLPWHPLSRAPSYFKPNIPSAILDDHEVKYHGKLVVATDDFIRPNIIAATGLPVLNNTSHYTDKSIFDEFYKNESNSSDYNRFHHMHIKITGSGDPKLEIPYGDVIRLSIPGNTFDFTRLHSDFLMTYAGNKDILQNNATLVFIAEQDGFAYYKIK